MTERSESERAELVKLADFIAASPKNRTLHDKWFLGNVVSKDRDRIVTALRSLAAPDQEPVDLTALAETIHDARWPEDRQMAITPFADEDKNGRDYCFRIARAMKDFASPLPAAGWDDDAMERAKDALFNVATIHGYRLGNVELNEAVRAVARALRHNAPASGATKSAACDHHYILMSVGPNGEPVHGVTVDRLSLYPEAMFCQWCNRPQEAQSAGREQNRAALKRSRGRS